MSTAQEPLLLVGAGGHAMSCIDVVECHGRFAVAGLVGAAHEVGRRVSGYPVIGTDADLPSLAARHGNVLIAVGQIETPEPRMRLFAQLQALQCRFPVIVSPRAYVSPRAELGEGCIVMHGAVVNAGAVIGRNCILNSLSLVEHQVSVADHCHLATGAVLNGDVSVGAGSFIGSNSAVRQGVRIGERCLVGMGQRVLADCAPGTRLPQRNT